MNQLFWIVTIILLVAPIECKNPTPVPPVDQYTLAVATPNNKTTYSKGETVTFNLRLLKNGSPLPNTALGVYDDLSLVCSSIAPTDANGNTSYQVVANKAGAFSFIFLHPSFDIYASYSLFIQETSVNDSFQVITDSGTPTLPLGSNQTINKQTFSQKSFDVTVNTLKDAATNPIFVGSLSLCLVGVAGTAAVGAGAPLAAVACPAAYNVFMGSLLWNVTNNAVDKFVTDPVQKQKAQGILNAAAVTQSVMAFNDAILQSPKGGKALMSYDYNSYQGTRAGQLAFQRIIDVGDAVNTLATIQSPRIQIINDSAFACSFVLSNPIPSGYSSTMNEERIVTIGVTLKSTSGTPTYLINDDFESYAVNTFPSSGGWILKYNGAGNSYQVITSSQHVSGTKSMQMKGSPGWSATMYRTISSTPSNVYFEGMCKAIGSTGTVATIGFWNLDEGTWGTRYAIVAFSDGNIHCQVGQSQQTIQTYNSDQWYKVKLKFDVPNATITVWINDQIAVQALNGTLSSAGYKHFCLLSEHTATSSAAFFDDVKVWTE